MTSPAQPAPTQPDPEIAVLQGVIDRLARELAQSRVTVAELDVRLQGQTAQTVRVEAERDQLRTQLDTAAGDSATGGRGAGGAG